MNINKFSAFICAVLLMPASLRADEFRTIDGVGNNAVQPLWGAAEQALMRAVPAAYPGDGTGTTIITSPVRPDARLISNEVFDQSSSIPSRYGLSSGVWQWGQFLDHDIDLTTGSGEDYMLPTPLDDPDGMTMIPFTRSNHIPCVDCAREQVNSITSFIDASNIYGSDAVRANALRAPTEGKLLMSTGGLLPTSDMAQVSGLVNDNGGNDVTMFVAGDIRANEQLGLTAMHTLFAREHNRLASMLVSAHGYDPVADNDLIYEKARAIVGAEIQAITYNEFLPMILGDFAPEAGDYSYDATVNASVVNTFSTATYRFGHTMLNEQLLLATEQGETVGAVSLRDAFFTGSSVLTSSPEMVDQLLMGLAVQTAQEIDSQMVDDVRNFLFASAGGMGIDLASLNIERGRDHGLVDYNSAREAYAAMMAGEPGFEYVDLSSISSFDDLPMDADVAATLEELYLDVGNIDLWVGALAEEHVPGASVGPLVLASLVDQFTRLRDGDKYFYVGNDYLWSPEVMQMVDLGDVSLMDIVAWNTEMKSAPMNFFSVPIVVPEPASISLVLLVGVAVFAGRFWNK